jgi:hypothetical protein
VTGGLLVALIAATPPTLAALLTFVAARSAMRRESESRAAVVTHSLDVLQAAVGRIERAVERVDTGVGDLRERVAHLEGASEVRTAGGS